MEHTLLERKQRIDWKEFFFRKLLQEGCLEFDQWKNLREVGEDVLLEQFDLYSREALERLGVTDDLLTWMYEKKRFSVSSDYGSGYWSDNLTFRVTQQDIDDFYAVCEQERIDKTVLFLPFPGGVLDCFA